MKQSSTNLYPPGPLVLVERHVALGLGELRERREHGENDHAAHRGLDRGGERHRSRTLQLLDSWRRISGSDYTRVPGLSA